LPLTDWHLAAACYDRHPLMPFNQRRFVRRLGHHGSPCRGFLAVARQFRTPLLRRSRVSFFVPLSFCFCTWAHLGVSEALLPCCRGPSDCTLGWLTASNFSWTDFLEIGRSRHCVWILFRHSHTVTVGFWHLDPAGLKTSWIAHSLHGLDGAGCDSCCRLKPFRELRHLVRGLQRLTRGSCPALLPQLSRLAPAVLEASPAVLFRRARCLSFEDSCLGCWSLTCWPPSPPT
jgi:hypothetical protein